METEWDFLKSELECYGIKSKFTQTMCEFEKKSEDLLKFIPELLTLFQWFHLTDLEERMCGVQHLGYVLRNALKAMRSFWEIRGTQLWDEQSEKFEEQIQNIDKQFRSIRDFIEEAEARLYDVDDVRALMDTKKWILLDALKEQGNGWIRNSIKKNGTNWPD